MDLEINIAGKGVDFYWKNDQFHLVILEDPAMDAVTKHLVGREKARLYVYNIYDDKSCSYERVELSKEGDTLSVNSTYAGTGTKRQIILWRHGERR